MAHFQVAHCSRLSLDFPNGVKSLMQRLAPYLTHGGQWHHGGTLTPHKDNLVDSTEASVEFPFSA